VAEAMLEGPVYCQYDRATPELQVWLRRGQPNCFLPLDRSAGRRDRQHLPAARPQTVTEHAVQIG
jgi:hypothetical protein